MVYQELVYHDEVFKTMLTETKTMQLFLSPLFNCLGTWNRPIKMKGNSKHSFVNSLSLLKAQNKGLGTASQTIHTRVKLHQ